MLSPSLPLSVCYTNAAPFEEEGVLGSASSGGREESNDLDRGRQILPVLF